MTQCRAARCYNRHAMTRVPLILCIGGHDPTGGAGIATESQAFSVCISSFIRAAIMLPR